MQEIKIDDLKIIKKRSWLSSFFTTNPFLIFLRLLSFNSLHRVELNQASINQIQRILSVKQVSNNIFNIPPYLQDYTQWDVYLLSLD